MTEKEYFVQIKEIRKHISNNRLDRAEQLLEKMYAYKPVRLLWFVAKAEYILKKENDPEAALRLLDGKYFSGADYPGLKACMKFRANTFRHMGREQDAAREEYLYQRACGKRCSRAEAVLEKALEDFAEDAESKEALDALGNAFYQTSDMAAYFIVRMVQRQLGHLTEDDRSERFYQITNFAYLEEQLCSRDSKTFILMMDEYLTREIEVLGYLLHCLGHQVFVLALPLGFETEEQIEVSETLMVSVDNMERYSDMCVIPPVVLARKNISYGDNREYIVDYICRQETSCDYAMLLCSGQLLDKVYGRSALRGRIGRLSPYESDIQEEKLQFGWIGSYLSYISNLYGYDVRTDVYAEPKVDFSILIPARNSSKTLRYTLETCLNQSYTGSYEIVVNDNSAEENREIYDLCQALNDPKIRYVKTPYNMVLAKSFEFGYLQTRGDFVFSIGSDDGVLPWALDVLKRVLDQFPQEEIVKWDRGFYAWPGFNGGQENMFQIPRQYEKDRLDIYYEKTAAIFDQIKEDPQAIYLMPLLYINSGFRRKYLRTLLEKTGKLLDGPNQDIQTGIINCCINKRILTIIYPLTIAGMSSNSIGYLENQISRKETQTQNRELFQWVNKGLWVRGTRERLMPKIGIDASGLFFVLSRAVTEGLLDCEEADKIFSWDTAVLRTLESFRPLREDYDFCVFTLDYIAKKLGKKQEIWFENLLIQALKPRCLDEQLIAQQVAQKSYQEGSTTGGGEVLDASKYDVENIVQAVALFARRAGLMEAGQAAPEKQ